MKLLFLTQLLPFPNDNGGKVKTLNTLMILKQLGVETYFLSFIDKRNYLGHEKKLKDYPPF